MPASYFQLDPDEKLIMSFRRHWIAIFPIFVSTTFVLAALVLAPPWLAANQGLVPGIPVAAIVTTGLMVAAPLSILILLLAYWVFRQSMVRLSTKYYLQITQNGIFSRTVSKLTLDEVQDARGTKKGILGTILNYGEVLIETAGEEQNFFFKPVANPLEVAEAINDVHEKYGHEKVVSVTDPTP